MNQKSLNILVKYSPENMVQLLHCGLFVMTYAKGEEKESMRIYVFPENGELGFNDRQCNLLIELYKN